MLYSLWMYSGFKKNVISLSRLHLVWRPESSRVGIEGMLFRCVDWCSALLLSKNSKPAHTIVHTHACAHVGKERKRVPPSLPEMTGVEDENARKRKRCNIFSCWVVRSNEITTTRCPERENLLVKYRIESMLVAETWKWRRSPSGEKRDVPGSFPNSLKLLLGVNSYRKEEEKKK